MMANASGEISNKLIDLRVVDPRSDLEKRGLDKTGVKVVLLERLGKALKSEGGSLGSEGKSDATPSQDLAALAKIEALCEEKLMEESQPMEDGHQNELTDNMHKKETETSDVALADVFLNTTNADITDNQILSSDTKPSDMLVNDTFDKDQLVEELPVTSLDTNKETNTVLQEEADDTLKDTTAPPVLSSSSVEINRKEENSGLSSSLEMNSVERNDAKSSSPGYTLKGENGEKSPPDSRMTATPPQSCNELKGDDVTNRVLSDSLPPTPTSVPCIAPFTLKDTISMDTSTTQQSEENESLIVHVDDTQNDLDADLVASKTNNGKIEKTPKDKVSGKSEVKKTDGSTVEEKAKGKIEGGQTEKKTDEKKDDKDVKSKSSSVSKPKVVKNIKSNNENSPNLWVSGLASTTCATDLKLLFTKYGKVICAKVVTNTRNPGAQRYGFVTMSSVHEASKCIQHLNKTDFHGRMISIEKTKREPGAQIIKMPEKKVEKSEVKKDERKDGDKEGVKKFGRKDPKRDDRSRRISSRRDDRRHNSSSRSSYHRTSDKSHVSTSSRGTSKPGTSKPDASKPGTSKPDTSKPSTNKPSTSKPSTSKPSTSKPATSKPATSKPATSKPGTSSRSVTKEGSEKGVKPLSPSNTKEKVANPEKPEPGEPTATTETTKDKSGKDTKKDILSFDRIKKRNMERLRQRHKNIHRLNKFVLARKVQRDVRKQEEDAMQLDKARERLRLERRKLEKEKVLRYRMEKELLQKERLKAEMMRLKTINLEKEKLLRYRLESELLQKERLKAEMMMLEMRHSMKRPFDRSNVREEDLWEEPKRSRISNSNNSLRFELPFQNESHYYEYDHIGGERHVELYDREMKRREMGPVRDIRDREDRQSDDRSRTDEKLGRMSYKFRRDMGVNQERYIGPESRQGDPDRQNISAHDRLGRMRNPLVGEPDQRPPWSSGSMGRKVDSWSHMHGDMDNSSMNRSNDQWHGNNINPTGRDASGAFVDHGNRAGNSGGMVQNMGPDNMYGNSQSQGGLTMVSHGDGGGGGNNMSGRIQEPRFDAYNVMGSM